MNSKRMTADAKAAPQTDKIEKIPHGTRKLSRLDQLQALLTAEGGSTIAEMSAATGWQQHSVRGAMAGALKKRGLAITSEKMGGVRRYHGRVSA